MTTTITSILRSGVTASGVYPTLSAWKASLPANLVTADQNHILNVEAVAGGYAEALSFDGYTTDPTRSILIQPAAGHGHAGVYDESKSLIKLPYVGTALSLWTQNITLRGMQIQQSGGTTSADMLSVSTPVALSADNLVTVERCILKGDALGSTSGAGGGQYAINVVDNTAGQLRRLLLRSNIIQDFYNSNYPVSTGIRALSVASGRVFAYNNTIVNCSTGIIASGSETTTTLVLKNNLIACKQSLAGRSDINSIAVGVLDAASTNNATSDGTAVGANARLNQTFSFVSSGSGDYHLVPGDAGALGFGADLSADASFPTTLDIDGNTYTVPYPIGADAIAAEANTLTIVTPVAGEIRQSLGGVANISVTGTYTGTLTAIKARIVLFGTSTPVAGFDWMTVVPTPTGNAFSFTLSNVPRGGGWYSVEVQDTVNGAINATSNKTGVGELIGVIGQSNVGPFIGNGAYPTNDLVRGYGPDWSPWQSLTGEGAGSLGTMLAVSLGCPIAIIENYASGTSISDWNGSQYAPALALFNSLGGKLGGLVFIQGERDWNGTSYAAYLAGLSSLFDTKFRVDLGQPNLPVVIVANGAFPASVGGDVSTYGQVKKAQYDYGSSGTHNYVVDRIDAELSDGLHMTIAGSLVVGQRTAQALRVDYGISPQYRGPMIQSITTIDSVTYEVAIQHRLGNDITPASGITGFVATDPGAGDAVIAITSAYRYTANKIRLVLASSPVSPPKFTYADGHIPVVTALARGNGEFAIPLEWSAGITAITPATSVTISLVDSSGAPAVSLTGLKWAFFDQATPGSFTAPVAQGTAESTDGSGNLVLDISGTLLPVGSVGWVVVTDSDGTTTQSPTYKHFSGPVVTA